MKIRGLLTGSLILLLLYIVHYGWSANGAGRLLDTKTVTFCSDIAPILQRSCQECHRPEGVAPMSLLTYDEVRPWAREIEEKVVQKIMPPYYAGGEIGRFVGDPRLTDEEIRKIRSWADSGAPKGDPSKLPPPREWVCSPWQGGTPDLVLRMPRPFTIKSDMKDGYAFFVMDYVFDQDTWIRGVEVSPGNRTAVHHANVYMVPSSLKTLADGRIDNVFDPVSLGGRFVTAWEPGCSPLIHPDGVGTLVRKGTRFAILMHYSPSDKAQSDQTSVGFYFAEGKIHKEAKILYGGTRNINLPARASNYEILESREVMTDAMVRAFTCHMHLRGKSFAVRFRYPDGKVETAFEVPHYDVNWQQLYVLVSPIFVPKRTIVDYVATWDNSPNNPSNPDPTKNVKWGDRATDEMMDGYLNYVSVHEDLNIDVKSGRLLSRNSGKGAEPPSRPKQAATPIARTAANHGPQAPAPASVKSSPAPVEARPAAAVKPSPAAVEPRPPAALESRSATARAKDGVEPAAKSAGGLVSGSPGGEVNRSANENRDRAANRRYLMVAGGIVLLVLFGGVGGYGLGRRHRSKEIAALVEACADVNAVPVESPASAAFRITTNR